MSFFLRIMALRLYNWIVSLAEMQDEAPLPNPIEVPANVNEEQRNHAHHPMAGLHNIEPNRQDGEIEIANIPEKIRHIPRHRRHDSDEEEYDALCYRNCGY